MGSIAKEKREREFNVEENHSYHQQRHRHISSNGLFDRKQTTMKSPTSDADLQPSLSLPNSVAWDLGIFNGFWSKSYGGLGFKGVFVVA